MWFLLIYILNYICLENTCIFYQIKVKIQYLGFKRKRKAWIDYFKIFVLVSRQRAALISASLWDQSGVGAQSVTVISTVCEFHAQSRKWNIYYIFIYFLLISSFSKQTAALISATQNPMSRELGAVWGTECLNTAFCLHYAGNRAKLIKKNLDQSHLLIA